jgi:hypothetical protein
MKKIKFKDIESFEHLDFVLKNTTPLERFKWLENAWDFWYRLKKNKLQDRFRKGCI